MTMPFPTPFLSPPGGNGATGVLEMPPSVSSTPPFPQDLGLPFLPRPVISPLDKWAKRRFQKYADELMGDELRDLEAYLLKLVEREQQRWRGRDERIREDRSVLSLRSPRGQGGHPHEGILGHQNKGKDEQEADNDEIYVSPEPWLFHLKVTNSLAGADFTLDVPSDLANTDASQQIDNAIHAIMREWKARRINGGGSVPLRELAEHALDGWICVLIMPDSTRPRFPWRIKIVPATEVYPHWDGNDDELLRVFHRYELAAADARDEFPEAEDLLEGREDDDPVTILAYYDLVYHCILLQGAGGGQGTQGFTSHQMVKPPVPHGARDLDGEPWVPWIIRLPLGDMSHSLDTGGSRDTTLVGPGILYGMHDTYSTTCKVISLLLNNVARSDNPPSITYVNPSNPNTEPISLKKGARNYLAYDREKHEIIDSSPNPGNLQPLLQYLKEQADKATLPAVFYGNTLSGVSGYAINLLTSAAKDIMLPYIGALESTLQMLIRRMLELYVNVTAPAIGPLRVTVPAMDVTNHRTVQAEITPDLIRSVGVNVDVTWGQITPQDEAGISQVGTLLLQSGVISRYDLRKRLGIKNPLLTERRIILEMLRMNPAVQQAIGPLVFQMSDDQLLAQGFQVLQIQQQMAAQQQMPGEAGRQAGNPGQGVLPTSVLPLEMQAGTDGRAGMAPPAQNPMDEAEGRQRDLLAQLLAGLGGSPPRI